MWGWGGPPASRLSALQPLERRQISEALAAPAHVQGGVLGSVKVGRVRPCQADAAAAAADERCVMGQTTAVCTLIHHPLALPEPLTGSRVRRLFNLQTCCLKPWRTQLASLMASSSHTPDAFNTVTIKGKFASLKPHDSGFKIVILTTL